MSRSRRSRPDKRAHRPHDLDVLRRLLDEHTRALAEVREEQHTQFTRMAQLQAELDAVKHRRGSKLKRPA